MQFSIIYSVDCHSEADLRDFLPRREIREQMDQTEDDEQYDYDYLEGVWEGGHHIKLTGILDEDQFAKFLQDTGMVAQEIETMGSIGAPGFGFGWAPAICFEPSPDCGDHDSIRNAYVTPAPDSDEENEHMSEAGWDAIKDEILARYGEAA